MSNKLMLTMLVKLLTEFILLSREVEGKGPMKPGNQMCCQVYCRFNIGVDDGEHSSRCQFLKGESLSR